MAIYINNQSKYLHRFLLFPLYSFLVFRFLLVPGFHALHCSVVVCAEAKGTLTFKDELPIIHLRLPAAKPTLHASDNQVILSNACDGDARCICINNAVFKHDSSWGTAGVGKKANNPGNMRPPSTWKPSVPMKVYRANGNGLFAKFESLEHGIIANVELYKRFYKDLTATQLYSRWTQTKTWDRKRPPAYLVAISNCYL